MKKCKFRMNNPFKHFSTQCSFHSLVWRKIVPGEEFIFFSPWEGDLNLLFSGGESRGTYRLFKKATQKEVKGKDRERIWNCQSINLGTAAPRTEFYRRRTVCKKQPHKPRQRKQMYVKMHRPDVTKATEVSSLNDRGVYYKASV